MDKFFAKKLVSQLGIKLCHRIPLIHQVESSECGMTCLAMICGYYCKNIDMITLRQQFNLSARGTTLSGLIGIAEQLGLSTRPLSLELNEIGGLRMPCILHWEFNHFVVLVSVRGNHVVLHDPACGRRTMSIHELSQSFTGIALEVWPGSTFKCDTVRSQLKIGALLGGVHGLKLTLGKIFCLSLVIETINLTMPVGTQLVMDHSIPAGDRGLLSLICIGLMMFILLRTVVIMLRSWSSLIMSSLINIQWQSGLFNHLLRLPLNYFERRKLGDIQSRFGSLNTLQETITSSIVLAIMDSITVIGVVIMMVFYGGWLSWLVLGFTTIYVMIRVVSYGAYRQLSEEALVRDARSKSYFMETLYGIATLKMQGMINRRCSHWLNLEINTINSESRVARMDLLFGGLYSFIGACDQVIILWLSTNLVIDNKMTIGMLIAFGTFRGQFTDRVFSLTNVILQLRMMSLHNERIADIALHSQDARKPDIPISNKYPVSLEVSQLSYRYDNHSLPVFSNLSFCILPGECVAITGHSGAGKTTLMRVLCGLFEPETGRIMVDGIDIQQIGVNNYHKMIGCVMQDDKLFSGTIRENICGFDENENRLLMIECAKASFIHDVIIKMPMGYETPVGELGEGLSGGEKQRIFIARALYCSPAILFMDEATSSLDHENERLVNDAIKKLKITRVIVAHRESTIVTADKVISLT